MYASFSFYDEIRLYFLLRTTVFICETFLPFSREMVSHANTCADACYWFSPCVHEKKGDIKYVKIANFRHFSCGTSMATQPPTSNDIFHH